MAEHGASKAPLVMPLLPTLSAGGFEVPVVCAVGAKRGDSTYLVYLSLIGPATTVVALWASLMDQRQNVVTLEGVGPVQLWQRQPGFADFGYHLAWRRRHKVLLLPPATRVVHLVTEPDLLTARDPQLADSVRRRRSARSNGSGSKDRPGMTSLTGMTGDANTTGNEGALSNGGQESTPYNARNGRPESMSARTGAATAATTDPLLNEQIARETKPLFVLLRQSTEDLHNLACRHLLYLAERIQWLAYYEPWADYLWQRGLATGEITPLSVWPAAPSSALLATRAASTDIVERSDRSDQQVQVTTPAQDRPGLVPFTPWIADAFLCQPNPLLVAADLPMATQQEGHEATASNAS
jgi:hypothetical protein